VITTDLSASTEEQKGEKNKLIRQIAGALDVKSTAGRFRGSLYHQQVAAHICPSDTMTCIKTEVKPKDSSPYNRPQRPKGKVEV
jgi:hypothetical protein